jgi:hypothetical protein
LVPPAIDGSVRNVAQGERYWKCENGSLELLFFASL